MPARTQRRALRVLAPAAWALAFAALLPLAMFFMATWLLGWRLQPVLTGSMRPTYPVGGLLVISPTDPASARVGTTIAFAPDDGDGRFISHRVVERIERPDGLYFRTQGDANRQPDQVLVRAGQVRGEVRWHVAYLGGWLRWLEWPRGFLVLSLPSLLLLGVTGLRDVVRRRSARRRVATACDDGSTVADLRAVLAGVDDEVAVMVELPGTMRPVVGASIRSTPEEGTQVVILADL